VSQTLFFQGIGELPQQAENALGDTGALLAEEKFRKTKP